jgi:hypothetical protein
MNETPTLVRFITGYTAEGVGEDGLPLYRETVRIQLSRPPYLEVERLATEDDQIEYPHPWRLYQQEQKGRQLDGKAGYPLAMWPAAGPAEVKMCADREIFTVEQLAKLAGRGGDQTVPPAIVELAKRARRMVELSKELGKHEAKISDLEGQIAAVREQNNELKAINETLQTKIQILAARGIAA